MKESAKSYILGIFMFIIFIACWVGSAYAAWDWISPNGFWEILLFIFAWGILFKVILFFLILTISTLSD
ncbi:MAG: hypothetical protein ACRCSR_07600 [Bacteroidales bacterium]